jgi:hypothetical protein
MTGGGYETLLSEGTRRLVLEHVVRATVVLGGEIRIEWEDA